MRLAVVIALLATIAVALVHVRRAEIGVRHEIQLLQIRQTDLRRDLSDQKIRLGRLSAPQNVQSLVDELSLDLMDKSQALQPTLAEVRPLPPSHRRP